MEKQLIDLGCGWCRTNSKCTMSKDCTQSSRSDWMHQLSGTDSYCADPVLLSMRPTCGPKINGGTRLELIGQNLGHSTTDIRVKMKPLNVNRKFGTSIPYMVKNDLDCTIIDDLYAKATKIVCLTKNVSSPVATNSNADEKFSVYVQTNTLYPLGPYSSFNASNQFVFNYVVPRIVSIEPRKGIKSGGTILKITGKHLSCGSDLKFVIDESPCVIVNTTSMHG